MGIFRDLSVARKLSLGFGALLVFIVGLFLVNQYNYAMIKGSMARTATVNELYDINLAIIDAGKEFLADNDAAAYQKNIRNFRIPLPPCRTQSHQKIWGGATALGKGSTSAAKIFFRS